jgi:polyisoprenoid-binding protein YceI
MNQNSKTNIITLIVVSFLMVFAVQVSADEKTGLEAKRIDLVFDNEKCDLSFFLKGNKHDTLGSPEKIAGTALIFISKDGILTGGKGNIKIEAAKLDTKDAARDKRMKKKFLHVKKFPHITFSATAITPGQEVKDITENTSKDKPLPVKIKGNLTIHGVTKEIELDVNTYFEGERIIADSETILLLQDYNIKNPSFLWFKTENEVQIKFHIELIKKADNNT